MSSNHSRSLCGVGCSALNAVSPPKSYMEILIPNMIVLGSGAFRDNQILWVKPLQYPYEKALLLFLSRENSMRKQSPQARRGFSPESCHSGTPIFDFQNSRTVRNTRLSFVNHSVCVNQLQPSKQTETLAKVSWGLGHSFTSLFVHSCFTWFLTKVWFPKRHLTSQTQSLSNC